MVESLPPLDWSTEDPAPEEQVDTEVMGLQPTPAPPSATPAGPVATSPVAAAGSAHQATRGGAATATPVALPALPADVSPDLADVAVHGFVWPNPALACYPAATLQSEALACEIVGAKGDKRAGRLTLFVPDQEVAVLQIPPARTTIQLHFDDFQSLLLSAPLAPKAAKPGEAHADILNHRDSAIYQVALKGGGQLTGMTVGHVELPFGLFLYPPLGSDGKVQRLFVPRCAYERFEVGSRIGEVLVGQHSATTVQVDRALEMQRKLRALKVGEILVARKVVTADQLLQALDRQSKLPMIRIGEALVSLGMIDNSQLREALAQQKTDRGVPLGEMLVRMGVVTQADLRVALARRMGFPLVDLDTFPVEVDALRKVGYTIAQRLRVMPLLMRDGRLIVALQAVEHRHAVIRELEFVAGVKVVPVLGHCQNLDSALVGAYGKIGALGGEALATAEAALPIEFESDKTDELLLTLEREGARAVKEVKDETATIEQSDNVLVRMIDRMIIQAHSEGVSDIHIESSPGLEKVRVRFRKDGVLHTYLELPPNYRSAIIGRIKVMCDLDISEKRKAQDGKINFAKFSPQHRIELRVATIPTYGGLEDVVMRILTSARPMPLGRLEMSERNLAQFKLAVERPYGLVLCVGPTGSGKTTTLHSALSYINVPERKIWTVEDPIEITQPGLRQVQVNARIGWTFAMALRALLRADPDVIMLGEIRDRETAQIAIEASLTGHLVLSTLHTKGAPETVTRLLDMGMDPFNFADSLLAVLAQRLVRRLCLACRTSRPATKDEVDELLADHMHAYSDEAAPPETRDEVHQGWLTRHARDGKLLVYSSPGCPHCGNSGYKGRTGLHELMVTSRELRHQIQIGATADTLYQVALREGMRTLRQNGIDKVLAGHTTIEEVRATSNV